MANDNITFTKADFVGLDEEVVNTVLEAFQSQNSVIDNLIMMGQQIESLIQQEMGQNTTLSSISNKAIKSHTSANNKGRIEALMVIGATYLFRLRTFLLDDSISFILGETIIDDEGNKKPILQNKILSQEGMLKSIRASFSSSAIVLQHNFNKLNSNEIATVNNASETEVWTMIQKAASVEGDYNKQKTGKGAIYKVVNKKRRRIYQSPDNDTNVFFRFSGKAHRVSKYYETDPNKPLTFFNNGWLYEWFQAKIVANNALAELKEAMEGSEHPLMPILKNNQIDNVKGIRGGDFSLGDKQGSRQAKYGNNKIISFVNIIQELSKINTILLAFKTAQQDKNPKATAQEIQNLFTDESLLKSLSLTTNEMTDRIINILSNVSTT